MIASYGQATAPRSQGFADATMLSVARDFRFFGDFTWGVEATPVFVVNQTRGDLPNRPRRTAYAVAVSPYFAWTYLPRTARFGVRLENRVGLFWGFSAIPAQGSRFNFLDQFDAMLVARAGPDRIVTAGFRQMHISNLGLAGPDNPGLSFYSGVVGLSWRAR